MPRQPVQKVNSAFAGKSCFSPDGRYIAYNLQQQPGSENSDIFLLAADGSRELPLVEHPADDVLLGWTPDGNHILFARDRSGSMSAWLLRVADGKPQGLPELVKQDIGQAQALGFTRAGSYYYGLAIGTSDVYTAEFDPAAGRVLTQPQNALHEEADLLMQRERRRANRPRQEGGLSLRYVVRIGTGDGEKKEKRSGTNG